MKKIMICILCMAVTRCFGQIRIGVTGGATTANLWQTDGYTGLGTGLSSWPITGFNGGIIAEIDLNSSGLMIQPSLTYFSSGSHLANSKGFIDGNNFSIDFTNTMLYVYSLKLPVNLVYKFSITNKWKVFAGIGPYISKTLSGSEKGYYKGDTLLNGQYVLLGGRIDNKAKIGKGKSYAPGGVTNIAPYDIGGNMLLGVEYKKFQFAINYSRGFSNVYTSTYAKAGNFAWNFSLSYMLFGHNKKPAL
jgi:hypothetical protein